MQDAIEARLLHVEQKLDGLNNKLSALLGLCLQQGTDMQEMAAALEEVMDVLDQQGLRLVVAAASDSQKSSPLS